MRLVCFPYAGGTASLFYPWETIFPADIQVCPVELPGRTGRIGEPMPASISELADRIIEEALLYFDRPICLFGHSLGALIAFELSRTMRQREMPAPHRLFISACRAPQIPYKRPPIHHLDDPEFLQAVGKLNGTPSEVLMHQELLRILLPALRADFRLAETYRYVPAPPLSCAISAIGGDEDEFITRGDLVAWHSQTTGPFNFRMVSGKHFFLQSQGSSIARLVAQALSERPPI